MRLTRETITGLARTHLDTTTADRWLALLRPAVQLVPAEPGDPVVARLGGSPTLPDGLAWPTWDPYGPLSFIAEIDLAALAATGLETGLALPSEGRLLAFYFDDPDGTGMIVDDDPESRDGWQLWHVTDTPAATDVAVELTATPVVTWPEHHYVLEHHGLETLPDAFRDALLDLVEAELGPDEWGHHLGGWARQVQGEVEWQAAAARLGRADYDAAHQAEASPWRPLLQINSDDAADTSFGDAGCLYWLSRSDAASPALDGEIGFTWQSC